jgi:DNA-binding response OmpR family regulator
MPTSIVLLDYHDEEREFYGDALRDAGFDVICVTDPAKALALAASTDAAAVVSRIFQPTGAFDGIELTRRIRATPSSKAIPVLLITSFSLSGYRDVALNAGCDDYLVLPVTPDQLVAAVIGAIERRGSQTP